VKVSILNIFSNQENRGTDASTARHKVEEEMTKAVLRYCAKCKHGPFEKDEGCNRITCPKCHSSQCYACGELFVNYEDHFGTGKPCRLFENTPERLRNEAAAAQERVVAEVLGKRPGLKVEDVLVDESLFQRGLNLAWKSLPTRVPPRILQLHNAMGGWGGHNAMDEGAHPVQPQDIEALEPPNRDRPETDDEKTFCISYHFVHAITIACVAGFTGAMIHILPYSALLNFIVFTLFWSFFTKFIFFPMWGLDLIFSFSASVAMSVITSQGHFGNY
jgi:hypothetical protein